MLLRVTSEVQSAQIAANDPETSGFQSRLQAAPATGEIQYPCARGQSQHPRERRSFVLRFPLLVLVDPEVERVIEVSSEPFHALKFATGAPCGASRLRKPAALR